jgi:hypothetical protein
VARTSTFKQGSPPHEFDEYGVFERPETNMIRTFDELKEHYRKGVKYPPELATQLLDGSEEFDTDDSSPPEDVASPEDTEPQGSQSHVSLGGEAPKPDFNKYIDRGLEPQDQIKLIEHGVRPSDAVNASLCRITSADAAARLDRVDTGEFAGIVVPYRSLLGNPGHCRIVLDKPATLPTRDGRRVVSILQPTRSTNQLFYVPGTTKEQLGAVEIPALLCESEFSALAALRLLPEIEAAPSLLPIGMGGPWGWRMTR